MRQHLVNFLETFMAFYQERDDITYVAYDGFADPVEVDCRPLDALNIEHKIEAIIPWLNHYLKTTDKVSLYDLYKQMTEYFFDVWVNPSLCELQQFNIEQGLPARAHLADLPDYEHAWADQLLCEMEARLAEYGYAIFTGHELIEYYLRIYDTYFAKDMTLSEWIDAKHIKGIDLEGRYLYDVEVDTMPVLIDRDFIIGYASQDLKIADELLAIYMEELLVTKRGIQSNKVVEDRLFDIYCYTNLRHYLKCQPFETKESSLKKLLRDSVDPTQPFIEVVMDGIGEMYINQSNLQTERDIIEFMNMAYQVEEIDLEAKTFNRKNILLSLMDEVITEDVLINNKPIRYTLGNK